MALEHIVEFTPAFDRRSDDPSENYGIHCVEARFIVKGPEGAVQFLLFTNWMLPHVQKELDARLLEKAKSNVPRIKRIKTWGDNVEDAKNAAADLYSILRDGPDSGLDEIDLHIMHPMPADIGYHSPKPMYEDQEPMGSKKAVYTPREPTEDNPMTQNIEFVDTGTFTPCPYLDGRPCYYDGSTLNAERYYEILLREGSEGLWKALDAYYRETFESEEVSGSISE